MRLDIQEPDKFLFETTYQVTMADINYGGHVGNERYLLMAQEARVQFYKWLGVSERNLGDDETGTILANSMVQYKAESFHADKLTIAVGVKDISRFSFDLIYRIERKQELIARIATTVVSFHLQKRKPVSLPQAFLKNLKSIGS